MNIWKKFAAIALMAILFAAFQTGGAASAAQGKELSMTEKKQLLREAADRHGIPAEILKAIALEETAMMQFTKAGEPVIAADGGIGIMQITMSESELKAKGYDLEKLKVDTAYNIEAGAAILAEKKKLSYLPVINGGDPNVIENWYFAIMAYNGASRINDPNEPHAKAPYQERVLGNIDRFALLPVYVPKNEKIDISYTNPDNPNLMSFPVRSYTWPKAATPATQKLKAGSYAYTWNNQAEYTNIRSAADGDVVARVPHYSPVKIVSGPMETSNPNNLYVMYKIEGNGFSGFVSSSLLREKQVSVFSDIRNAEQASAAAFLQMRGIISGYPGNVFKPNEPIVRRHAAAMLVKALGLKLPEGYKMKAADMKPGDQNYQDMLIAEANGLFGGGGKLKPNEPLSRAQMASVLNRAYGAYYDPPTDKAVFKDIPIYFWNYSDINVLAHNKITVTEGGAFRPNESVTRAQFSLFMKRSIELKEAKAQD